MATESSYVIRSAASDADLRGIIALQAANRRDLITPEERASQGFVTLRHDLDLLRAMNTPWPHIVVTTAESDDVVGYALVMLPSFRARIPLLEPLFERIETLAWRGRPLTSWRWYIMGQVCVAKDHRGRGLVERMYAEHRRGMSPAFDVMVTDISRANPRSLRAHEKAGFEAIDEFHAQDSSWVVVAMHLAGE